MDNLSKQTRPALVDGKRRYFLNLSGPTMIGQRGCAILLNNSGVAIQHARLTPARNGYTIEMVGGDVLINESLINAPTPLNSGDLIKIGEVTLTYDGPSAKDFSEQILSYDALYEKVKDSVVCIHTSIGMGSGFYVKTNGLIVTNRHVVGYERDVTVQTTDGKQLIGRVLRSYPEIDLAFIRVQGSSHFIPPFCPPGMVRVGQSVLVIGNPLGLANTLTRGIISAINREIMGNIYLQTDAAINPGNSGGPLFNDLGEIIGVATMGIGSNQGLNFAVPIEFVRTRMEQFILEESRVQFGQGIYCNICGYFSIGGAHCPNCGVSLPNNSLNQKNIPNSIQQNQCQNCGKMLISGDQFCSACGKHI